jgi:hypothetical protein
MNIDSGLAKTFEKKRFSRVSLAPSPKPNRGSELKVFVGHP